MRYPTVLHISDLHRKDEKAATNKELIESLKHDIRDQYPKDNRLCGLNGKYALREPDLVVVSGDLVQSADPKQYYDPRSKRDSDVYSLLRKLAGEMLKGELDRIVIVPGNHDINWGLSGKGVKEVPKAAVKKGTRAARVGDGTTYYEILNGKYEGRLRPFGDFWGKWYGGREAFPERLGYRVFDFESDWKCVFVAMSSVGECDHLCHRGKLNDQDIDAVSEALGELRLRAGTLRIAVWHHGVVPGEDAVDFVRPGQVTKLGGAGIDLCLHGHTHQNEFYQMGSGRGQMTVPVVGAGSLAANWEERPDGIGFEYNLIRFAPDGANAVVHTRNRVGRYTPWQPQFWETTEGYKPYYEVGLGSVVKRKERK